MPTVFDKVISAHLAKVAPNLPAAVGAAVMRLPATPDKRFFNGTQCLLNTGDTVYLRGGDDGRVVFVYPGLQVAMVALRSRGFTGEKAVCFSRITRGEK